MRYCWAVALLTGCQLGAFDDEVYWLQLADDGTSGAERVVEHNFADALVDGESEPADEGQPTVTIERARSDGGLYAYVQRADDGVVFVHLQGLVLTGRVDGGVLTADWSAFDDRVDATAGVGLFRAEAIDETDSSFVLQLDRAGAGTLEVSSERRRSFTESDVWDPKSVGVATSAIPSDGFLVPDPDADFLFVENTPAVVECLRDPCVLSVIDRTRGAFAVDAVPVAGGSEQFDALGGFEPPEGDVTF